MISMLIASVDRCTHVYLCFQIKFDYDCLSQTETTQQHRNCQNLSTVCYFTEYLHNSQLFHIVKYVYIVVNTAKLILIQTNTNSILFCSVFTLSWTILQLC